MFLLLQMFESTGWLLEEPEVSDTSKFDMIFPTVVRPPNSTSVLQGVDDIEVSLPCLTSVRIVPLGHAHSYFSHFIHREIFPIPHLIFTEPFHPAGITVTMAIDCSCYMCFSHRWRLALFASFRSHQICNV
jgi:hypothetical protein